MIKLSTLTNKLPCCVFGDKNQIIRGISCHSQKTKTGYIFVALNGFKTSGKKYIEDAIKNGACVFVTDDQSTIKTLTKKYKKVTGVFTATPRQFLSEIANRFYDYPSNKLFLIGITGTDGKTTTSYMIKSIIEASGNKTGLIGTIKYFDGKKWLPAPNTTPDSLEFISFLAKLVKNKISYCISEVSSHALALGRVRGLNFQVGIFTNLAQDHLDFHKTKKAYGQAKLKLFTNLSSDAYAVINYDDPFSKTIIKNTRARKILYSLSKQCDILTKTINASPQKTEAIVYLKNHHPLKINLPMLGNHNLYNMSAAIGTAQALKIPDKNIIKGLRKLPTVSGRLERLANKRKINVFIDYAHTPLALKTAIETLRPVTKGKLIVVFGCGGNRDKLKRPIMGRIAVESADYVFITSDNPRNENPKTIIDDITKGINKKNYRIIIDRKQAIGNAIAMAQAGDTVLIAGKGHEQYQIIKNKTIHFCDKETAKQCLSF